MAQEHRQNNCQRPSLPSAWRCCLLCYWSVQWFYFFDGGGVRGTSHGPFAFTFLPTSSQMHVMSRSRRWYVSDRPRLAIAA